MVVKETDFPLHISVKGDVQQGGMGLFISFDNLEVELRKKQELSEDTELKQITIEPNGIIFVFKGDEDEQQ